MFGGTSSESTSRSQPPNHACHRNGLAAGGFLDYVGTTPVKEQASVLRGRFPLHTPHTEVLRDEFGVELEARLMYSLPLRKSG